MSFSADEIVKLEKFLQTKFSNPKISLKARAKAADSVEFLLDGEYLGTVYKDEDDGDIGYDVNISVLALDLEDQAA
jgi:hypothetical protein